jgi:Mn2+/Fe2+ NRAMP family transporter
MTGVIGFFVVVACAETLHASGRSIEDASDAARALEPLAGGIASLLFGLGLLGAALLAASILPLATAYSVSEVLVVIIGAGSVLVPGAPLVQILFLTQALNAVLLLPLLVFLYGVVRDRDVMGEYASGRTGSIALLVVIALIALCVAALALVSVL